MLFLVIWLFFLKTGSIITQIKSVWSSNQQWLVHWVTLLHNKKSQHCWLTRIADQLRQMNCKKTQYCKKASVKIGGFFMILCSVDFVNYLLPLVWGFWLCVVVTETELEEKIIPLLVLFFFLTNTWIWLFFLKTGSIITQIKSVWSSNQQWLVHWVTLLHNKKSQHCWLTRIADQLRQMNCKKTQYCKKASVKIGGFFMILCSVDFVNYLLPLVWGFWLCVVVTETELEEKIIPLLVLFFVWRIPVHRFVHRALIVQIARVTFSEVPFCHGWFWLPFLKGWGGGCQVLV